jgi:1-hydroxycarotenoid 3,4-desaturase
MAEAALREHRVVVIGAGIGGLTSALLLAHQGLHVTLVEAADAPGGKMRQVMVDGAAIDAGPTVFTMRWVFEHILERAGASLAALPTLTPLAVLARHAWLRSERTLDLYTDRQRSADAIAQFSSPDEARRFLAFCDLARSAYSHLEGAYIRASRPSMARMAADLGPRGLAVLAGLGPGAAPSLWQALARQFRDARLQQLFARYATYCGASPWLAPATLMLIAHVELEGVWSVQGGMHALAQAFAALAAQRGATLRYTRACERILVQGERVRGVRLAGGEEIAADAVVFNGDKHALAAGLLGPGVQAAVAPTPREQRSLSAVTWAVHAQTDGFALARHNVFFDDDYASEFDDIFTRRRLPRQGTVYVCAQDRGSDGAAAAARRGRERLLCLVNAPPDGDRHPFDATETDPCEHRSLALLRHCGLHLNMQSPSQVLRTTPADFARLFPATGGALYGAATHGWMSAFRRPGASTAVPGLYLAGGSVHPGPGVPMAALSGALAADALMAHLGSTSRLHPVRTSGGTSMRSATTAGRA